MKITWTCFNGTRSAYRGDRKNIQRITVTGDGGINKDGDNGEDLNGKKRHHHCRQKKAGHAVALKINKIEKSVSIDPTRHCIQT